MKSIEQINKEREKLKKQLANLDRLESFKRQCSIIVFNNHIAEAFTKLLNAHEEKEYICTTIKETFKKEPYYEPTGYYDDDPSGCGGGWVTTGEKLVTPPDEQIEVIVIMEKDIYDLFQNLKFSTSTDFLENLRRLTSKGKQYISMKKTFNPTSFKEQFPYLNIFLKAIADSRYENNTLDVDINSILSTMLKCERKLKKTNSIIK